MNKGNIGEVAVEIAFRESSFLSFYPKNNLPFSRATPFMIYGYTL